MENCVNISALRLANAIETLKELNDAGKYGLSYEKLANQLWKEYYE